MTTKTPLIVLGLCAPLAGGCSAVNRGHIEEFRNAHGDFFEGATSRPPIALSVSGLSDGEVDGEPGSFDFEELELEASVPLPLGRDDFLVLGVNAGRRDYEFSGAPVADDTLHRYGLRFGYGRFLNDDTVVSAYLEPSIYTDLDGTLTSRDYRLWYGSLLAIWRASPTLYYKLGFRLTDSLDTGVIPLIGATWHVNPKFRLEALLPRDVVAIYSPSEDWRFSAGLANRADEFHVRGPSGLGEPEHDVHVRESQLFLGAERRWNEKLSVFARIGSAIVGSYDWSYGGGQPELDGDLEPSTTMMVGVGLWL